MTGRSLLYVFSRRKLPVYLALLLAFSFIIGKLFYMQVMQYDYYQEKVIDQVTVESTEKAARGNIYGANMEVLATNITAWRVFISPRDIKKAESKTSVSRVFARFRGEMTVSETEGALDQSEVISRGLADILDVDYETIKKKTEKKNRLDETIKAQVDEKTKNRVLEFVEQNGLTNQVHVQALSVRYYPHGSVAGAVLGFTGTDGNGLYGLEYSYDSELTGTPGRYITARDGYGNDMPYDYETYFEAESGLSVVTTIDPVIQKSLERQLELTFAYSAPNARAAGIVMNVKTGAILAMGVAPGFDPNSPYTLNSWYQGRLDASGKEEGTSEYNELKKDYLLEMWSNKTVSELYEPGSTFKVITAAMALESGAVRETDHFYCNGAYYVGGFKTPIHCHLLWGHGDVTFRTGLQKSCNPTLMATSERIGADRFYDYFGAFGFFARSGVDLPGEALTYFHSKEGFGPVELAVASFGQRFKTSMIQQITAISCVANGGSLITPHLLSALVDENGKTVYSYEPEVKRQVISESVSRQINDILEESVFVQGGNPNAYVKGYRVSAKTGTSEKFDVLDENGNSYLRVGSTVAYAPANDPEIAVLIIVDEPTCSNTYGSNVAAPYVAQLLSEALPYLGFEPSYTAEELATLEMNVGNYVGLSVSEAKEKGRSAGLTVDVVGDGDSVTSQVPSSGVYVTKGSARVVLYTGNELAKNSITVPDVAEQTAAAASQSLVNAGLSVHVIGATDSGTTGAVVIDQSPSAGEVVTKGTVVTITMRHLGNTD